MIQPLPAEGPLRLGKGQKLKEAIVTSLYTIAPYVRTPQDVRAALLHEQRRADHPSRPCPVQKETRASLAGKAAAMQTLPQRATKLDLVLAGQTQTVISQLAQEVARPTWTESQRAAIERTLGYYERNQASMRGAASRSRTRHAAGCAACPGRRR